MSDRKFMIGEKVYQVAYNQNKVEFQDFSVGTPCEHCNQGSVSVRKKRWSKEPGALVDEGLIVGYGKPISESESTYFISYDDEFFDDLEDVCENPWGHSVFPVRESGLFSNPLEAQLTAEAHNATLEYGEWVDTTSWD